MTTQLDSVPENDAVLEDGWQPSTPLGDTLLRRYVLNLAASFEAHAVAMGGRVTRRDDLAAADLGGPSGIWNSATLLRPLGPEPDRVLDTIEAFYRARGTGEVLLWSAWPTPDLRSRGWRLEGHPPLLIRPAGAAVPDRPEPPQLRIAPVIDPDGVRDWERVVVDGFPFPDVAAHLPGAIADQRIIADDRIGLWVGYADEQPVVAGSLFVAGGIRHLTLGVTLPQARLRGYWTAMVWQRLRVRPDLPAAALFSDMSRPGAEALGFLPILRFTLWHRPRPDQLG